MFDLPKDVQLLVLDSIKLKSDLKSLCLTSKAARAIATPRLYAKIVLNMYKPEEVQRYFRCMVAGGGINLKSTRSLTLIDTMPPPEAYSVRPVPLLQFFEASKYAADVDDKVNGLVVYNTELVLGTLPTNCLHTFRFLSTNALPEYLLLHLQVRQGDSLQRLQVSRDGDRLGRMGFKGLRALDMWLTKPATAVSRQMKPSTFDTDIRLERLCLAAANDSGVDYCSAISRTLQISKRHWITQDTIKSLTLYGLALDVLHDSQTQIVHLSALTQLTLWNCSNTHILLNRIVQSPSFASLKLKHFGLTIHADSERYVEEPLGALFRSSTCISSLCLQWDSSRSYYPHELVKHIEKIGRSLRLLSLHSTLALEESQPLDDTDFRKVCESCPNLEQLGYRISEIKLYPMIHNEYFYAFLIFITFRSLPKLRILHLRQGFGEPFGERETPYDSVIDATLSFGLQRFADRFFQRLTSGSACPALQAFVIGQENRLCNQEEQRRFREYTPLHCYLKSEMKDTAGRRRVVASPITAHELRVTTDIADILDWHTGRTESAKWMARIPGRFNDD